MSQMEYQVIITETLSRIENIEASSAFEAEEKARSLYVNERIILDFSDFIDVCFHVSNQARLGSPDHDFTLPHGDCK